MRYAIQKIATGAFFTECDITGTVDTIEADQTGSKFVHQRHVLSPKFGAFKASEASKFETESDAKSVMTHKQLASESLFDGCEVVQIEV
jgi:hypothetical protein